MGGTSQLSCGIYGPLFEDHRKQWDLVQCLFGTSAAFYLDIRFKVLDYVADEVLEHYLCLRPCRPYGLFVVSVGVTVLLGHHNPPRSWTGTWVPPLSG
jgi:hypothetical protein